MPVYEYHCPDCDRVFDRVESMNERDDSPPRCPHCGGEAARQRFSPFFAKTARKS